MMRIDSESMRKQILVSLCKGSTFFVIVQVYVVFYTKYCRYETHNSVAGTKTKSHELLEMGGRSYPVHHYPIAIRLRDRKGRAILCLRLSSKWGLVGRCTWSAFRRTPSHFKNSNAVTGGRYLEL
jgi:hypothetical protein